MTPNEPSPYATPVSEPATDFSEYQSSQPLQPIPPSHPDAGRSGLELLIAFGTWIVSILFLLFVPLVLVIPYIIYLFVSGHPPTQATLGTDKGVLFFSILGVIPAHSLTFFMIWLIVTRAGKLPFFKTAGLEWPKTWSPVKWSVVCIVFAVILLAFGLLVTKLYGGGKTQLDLLTESSTQARLATAFIAFATAPLVEELIYRGLLYSALERTLGVAVAVIVVSILFAGVHVLQYINNISVIAVITLLSVSLTLVRAYSGKLLPSVVIHLVFNGVQSVMLAFQPYIEGTDKNVPPAPGFEVLSHLLHRFI
ncbi:MAG TPA: type II CAAX endopeptidase family protein [Pyrinomonadaceae bacterium]|nr:type II CAAX endopeptidase family protein [Pyrinomonadaceae bacterium]